MNSIELWQKMSVFFLVAGICLIAYAGYLFYRDGLYGFISMRYGLDRKKNARADTNRVKKKQKKKHGEKHVTISEDLSDGLETMAAEIDVDGSLSTMDLDENGKTPEAEEASEERDTSLLTEKMRAEIGGAKDGALWFKPSKGFYTKKSIMITNTEKTITEGGEII